MLFVLSTSVVYGQLGTASITGTVTDEKGATVAGARVTIKNVSTGVERETVTSSDGVYSLTNLRPANYGVRIEAQGFATAVFKDVQLEVGQNLAINATLKVAAVQEVVEVVGGAAPVDTTTSQVAGIVESRTVEALPLNGRNFLDLAFLIPGNTPAPNFDPTKVNTIEVASAGQLGRGGNIAVDGADNNDDVVGGTLQNFPQDGIQEFQIVTNRFSAEIGRSASSAINIVTKSGTNDWHGSGSFFFRHDELQGLPTTLDRRQLAVTGQPQFDREQYAFTIGGPLYKDRAWHFTAFEYRNQDDVVLTGERDFNRRQVVNTFAPAPLNDLLLTSRVDWQAGSRNKLAFRYSLQDEDDITRGSLRAPIGSSANRQISTNNYQSFVFNWIGTISPTVLNDFTFHENNFINRIIPAGTGNELRFPSLQDGQNFRVPQRTRQNRLQARDNLSFQIQNHSLKAGFEFQRIDADAVFDLFGSGTVILTQDFATMDRNGDGQINDQDIPVAVTIRSVAPNRPPTVCCLDNTFYAIYFQDDWRVRPNFTLNFGVRWEYDTQTIQTGFRNPLLPARFGQGTANSDKNNFGPRFGFNWDPWGDGKTSIHGGYGLYYDRIVLEVPLLEELLDGRALPLEVRDGSNGANVARPFVGNIIPGAGAIGINIISPSMATPYVQQFNFGIEREVVRDLVVSADYLHSFGRKFIIGRPVGTVFNPVVGGVDGIVSLESSVGTWYDALLLNVKKRFSHRFQFNAAYTLSKTFNFSNDDQIPFQVGPLDPNNLRLEKGPPPGDQRHRFVFSGAFDLPYGFQIAPIWTMASDVPIDIQLPPDIGGTRIPQLQRNAGGRTFRTGSELNAFIQQLNSSGGVGGTPLPLVRDDLNLGDSFNSFDVRVSKYFTFGDRAKLELIGEVFNLFNVTNILGVNNVNYSGFQNTLIRDSSDRANPGFLRSTAFGQPLNTAGGVFGTGGSRAVQFAVRFSL